MSEIVRGIVAAILNFLKGIISEPTKSVDADDTAALRDRIRDRVRRAEGSDGTGGEGSPSSGA